MASLDLPALITVGPQGTRAELLADRTVTADGRTEGEALDALVRRLAGLSRLQLVRLMRPDDPSGAPLGYLLRKVRVPLP